MPESKRRRIFNAAMLYPLTHLVIWLTIAATIAAIITTLCATPGQCQTAVAEPVPDPVGDAIACPPRGIAIDGRVVHVVDGDTVDVEMRFVFRVRLLDCWAPESRTTDAIEKARGLQSKQRMIELADGRDVRVFIPATTGDLGDVLTLDRVLGHVWPLDGGGQPHLVSLSARMVAEGFATAEKEPPPNREGKR